MSSHEPNRENANREDARRKHRAIALFCVIQCWIQKLDGITLNRPDLERLLGRERFKKARVDWLCEDFRDFFPFCQVENEPYENPTSGYLDEKQETFSRLILSRIPLNQDPENDFLKLWRLPNEQELSRIDDFIPFLAEYNSRDYSILTLYLSLLAQGEISPKSISPLKEYYRSPEEIVIECLRKLAEKLILEDRTVAKAIANSNNHSGWLYDTYDNLTAWFTVDGGIEFFVEIVLSNRQYIVLSNRQDSDSFLYSNRMTIKVNGELSYVNKKWILENPKNVTIKPNN